MAKVHAAPNFWQAFVHKFSQPLPDDSQRLADANGCEMRDTENATGRTMAAGAISTVRTTRGYRLRARFERLAGLPLARFNSL